MLVTGTRTLGSGREDRACRLGDLPFLSFEAAAGGRHRPWTFRELDADANRAAHLLRRGGLGRGDKFNLHLGNRPEFLLSGRIR